MNTRAKALKKYGSELFIPPKMLKRIEESERISFNQTLKREKQEKLNKSLCEYAGRIAKKKELRHKKFNYSKMVKFLSYRKVGTNKLMDANEIISILKLFYKVKRDTKLSAILGITRITISRWREGTHKIPKIYLLTANLILSNQK